MIEKILIIAVILVLFYYVMDLFFKKKKPVDGKKPFDMNKSEYTLRELAEEFWLKNEMEFISEEPTEEEIAIGKKYCPTFINEETKIFWDEVIAYNYKWLLMEEDKGFSGLINAIKALLLYIDLPENARLSSTSSSIGRKRSGETERELDDECAIFRTKGTYEVYQKINLLPHILGVATEIVPIITQGKKHYMWIGNLGEAILAALGHDLGKIEKQKNPSDTRSHQEISDEEFIKLCGDLISEEKIAKINNAILLHHTVLIDNSSNNPLSNSLIDADQKRRVIELEESDKKDNGAVSIALSEQFDEIEKIATIIRKRILSIITEPGDGIHYIIYDRKKKTPTIYIKNEFFETLLNNEKISKKNYLKAMTKLKDDGIVTNVNFNNYEFLSAKIKYNDNHELLDAQLIPINYSSFDLTQLDITHIYKGTNMPKVLPSNYTAQED